MGIVIGIDVGISTTKIVGINEERGVMSPIRIKATDPVTSLYGAFGKYLYDNNISLADVEQVMITGVGSAYIDSPIYGLPTKKAEEFIADGLGARYETELDRMIVVSMGTGTSLVQCCGDDIRHIGGVGIGGGTLMGLSRIMLKSDDIKQVATLAMQGDLANIDAGRNQECGCSDWRYQSECVARTAQECHREPIRKCENQCHSRRYSIGYHHHGIANNRQLYYTFISWQRYQGVRSDRKSYAVTAVQGCFSCHGKALSCTFHHPEV